MQCGDWWEKVRWISVGLGEGTEGRGGSRRVRGRRSGGSIWVCMVEGRVRCLLGGS